MHRTFIILIRYSEKKRRDNERMLLHKTEYRQIENEFDKFNVDFILTQFPRFIII